MVDGTHFNMNRPLLIALAAAACVLTGIVGYAVGLRRQPSTPAAKPVEQNRPRWIHPGWEYHRDRYRNAVRFHFGDADGTEFVGLCDARPIFLVSGGKYNFGTTKFELTIDGLSQVLPAFQGVEGRSLPIDDPAVVERIKQARSNIAVQVGNWKRGFRPGPELGYFFAQCAAIRQRDPEATGRASDV